MGTSTRADACAFTGESQLLLSPSVPDGSESRETCAHVSTPWSVSRDTPEKLSHMLDSLVRVSQQERWGKFKTLFLSVTVWEPGRLGTCGQDKGTRGPRSPFPHDEMDTVLHSQAPQRTVMASGAPSDTEDGITIQQILADGGCSDPTRRQRIAPTTTMDVIDRHGDSDSHKKLSQFVSSFSSG